MTTLSAPPTPASLPLPPPPTDSVPHRKRIEMRGLLKSYRRRNVVNGVDLHMEQGEIVGLLGPNGAGKTTTFYMVVGLVRPDRGNVLLDGKDITRTPMYQRARLGIGYLPQEASVFRKLTAKENLLLVLEMVGYKGNRKKRAEDLLEELHIGQVADTRGYSLSGGERRRVEIARALAADPSFLLLDEPFAGVDPIARADIADIVNALKARGIGILITDHEAREVLALTDRAYILTDGKVVTQGTATEVANDPIARKHYLGQDFRL